MAIFDVADLKQRLTVASSGVHHR